ncbi:MAG: hypothetical protein J6U39_03935 [Clostridia bacterium]|nr:hypothetical protein [Clostridia bacterium]
MKKVLLVILILTLCAAPLLFAACSSVSQRDLLTTGYVCSKDGYELFTYDVYMADEADKYTELVGTMTMKFEPKTAASFTLPSASEEGEKQIEGFTGTLLSTDLTMLNGDTITSRVIYDSACVPTYSYKRTSIKAEGSDLPVVKEMQVSYEGKYLYADLYVDGEKISSVEHKASGYYDNESIYAIVRASAIGESSYSLSFSCVNALTGTTNTMSISRQGEVNDAIELLTPANPKIPEGQDKYTTPTYVFSVSTDNQYASPYYMEITQKAQDVVNDKINIKNVKKVITTIIEGKYKYTLVDVEIK